MPLGEKFKAKHPKLAKFLEEKAPKVLNTIGGVLPDSGYLGIIKNLITSDPDISPEDKLEYEKIHLEALKEETKQLEIESAAVTARWQADMASDSWMSKNTRPLGFLSLLGFLFLIIVCDSLNWSFEVKPGYITLLETLLVTVTVAYYGSRGIEKFKSIHEAKNLK